MKAQSGKKKTQISKRLKLDFGLDTVTGKDILGATR